MEENFSAKRHDATTIKNNIDDLVKLKVKIDELNAKVTEEDNALFNSNGRHIKSGHKFSHDTNEEFLESLKIIKKTVGETMELLEKAPDKVVSIFPLKQGNALKRKSRMQKQNRHKSEKRRGSYRGGSLARFTSGKNRGSRITNIKIPLSRITKIRKSDSRFHDVFLH